MKLIHQGTHFKTIQGIQYKQLATPANSLLQHRIYLIMDQSIDIYKHYPNEETDKRGRSHKEEKNKDAYQK